MNVFICRHAWFFLNMCVCVCVWVRERERERQAFCGSFSDIVYALFRTPSYMRIICSVCSHSVTEVCLRFHLRFLTASSSLWHCGSMNNGQYSLPVSVPHVLYLLIGNCVLNSGLWGKRAERRGESRVARPLDWINILTSIDNNTNTELIFSLHESRPLLPWCAKAIPSVRPSVCLSSRPRRQRLWQSASCLGCEFRVHLKILRYICVPHGPMCIYEDNAVGYSNLTEASSVTFFSVTVAVTSLSIRYSCEQYSYVLRNLLSYSVKNVCISCRLLA